MFLLINKLVDSAIGARDLPAQVRQVVLRQQLVSLRQMMPAMTAGALILSAVFGSLAWSSASFETIAIMLAIISALQLAASYLGGKPLTFLRRHKPGRVALYLMGFALLQGALWGLALNLVPMDLRGETMLLATLGVVGLLGLAVVGLLNYPQALAAFALPLVVGLVVLVTRTGWTTEMAVVAGCMVVIAGPLVRMLRRHAAAFVAQRAAQAQDAKRREITGLLLGDFEQSPSDWIWGLDDRGAIAQLSAGFTTATGLAQAELIGADFIRFMQAITPADDPLMALLEADVAARHMFHNIELRVTAAGEERWWRLTGKPSLDDDGRYLGYIGTGSDVTERKQAERRMTMLGLHDGMTGLWNRSKFTEQLHSCIARLERHGTPFSILLLNLDGFKAINDGLGHVAGDQLLVRVADRLDGLVHEPDLAARLGSDEFAVIMPNNGDADRAGRLADALIAAVGQPCEINGEPVRIGMSVGIVIAPLNGMRPDQILRSADLALQLAKADGGSRHRFFDSEMDGEARKRRQVEVELRDAIIRKQLVLYYQPVVSSADEQVIGFEALIRWNHPERGVVSPAAFIPAAEHSNLIVEIGDWTIEQACMAAASWPEHLTVAVNLSAKHFRRSDTMPVVQRALAISGLAPERLELEITETLLMDNPQEVVRKLAEIRRLGVKIAIDDFGTGDSSLSYLLKFPFDKIKIDRSFVDASSEDGVARDVLKAIASLGRTLRLTIIGEGVETREQARFLTAIGCQHLQGFLFARPLDPVDLPHYLLTHVPGRAEAVKAEAERQLTTLAS